MAVYARHHGVGFGTNNLGSAANDQKKLLVLSTEAFQINSHSLFFVFQLPHSHTGIQPDFRWCLFTKRAYVLLEYDLSKVAAFVALYAVNHDKGAQSALGLIHTAEEYSFNVSTLGQDVLWLTSEPYIIYLTRQNSSTMWYRAKPGVEFCV